MSVTKQILVLNANIAGIGTYHRALNFGRALADRGHSVTMMTVSPRNRFRSASTLTPSGLRVVECPRLMNGLLPWHGSGPADIAVRLGTLLRRRFDAIYAFEYQPNVTMPSVVGKFVRGCVVISDWCDWHAGAAYWFRGLKLAHRIDRFFEEWIRRRSAHLTVISTMLYDRARSMGIPEHQITLIREGVDPEYMRPRAMTEARGAVGLPVDGRLVGSIRDSPKGLEVLLRAVRKLRSRWASLQVVYIGTVSDTVRGVVQMEGAGDLVRLVGRVSDEELPYYLSSCDALALPLEDNLANRARWPHKLGDMIAVERPVITTAVGDFPRLLQERNAAVITSCDVAGFAAGIGDVLESPRMAAEIARRGRDLAEGELSWKTLDAQVVGVVEQVA